MPGSDVAFSCFTVHWLGSGEPTARCGADLLRAVVHVRREERLVRGHGAAVAVTAPGAAMPAAARAAAAVRKLRMESPPSSTCHAYLWMLTQASDQT
jgi:hypothetical protein